MIHKSRKIIFEGEEGKGADSLTGGMPLAIGDIVHLHQAGTSTDYEVIDKIINYTITGDDHNIDITYTLRKKI